MDRLIIIKDDLLSRNVERACLSTYFRLTFQFPWLNSVFCLVRKEREGEKEGNGLGLAAVGLENLINSIVSSARRVFSLR